MPRNSPPEPRSRREIEREVDRRYGKPMSATRFWVSALLIGGGAAGILGWAVEQFNDRPSSPGNPGSSVVTTVGAPAPRLVADERLEVGNCTVTRLRSYHGTQWTYVYVTSGLCHVTAP